MRSWSCFGESKGRYCPGALLLLIFLRVKHFCPVSGSESLRQRDCFLHGDGFRVFVGDGT